VRSLSEMRSGKAIERGYGQQAKNWGYPRKPYMHGGGDPVLNEGRGCRGSRQERRQKRVYDD